jgi:hypothetical protein
MAMDMFTRTSDDLMLQVEDITSTMDFRDKAVGDQVSFI